MTPDERALLFFVATMLVTWLQRAFLKMDQPVTREWVLAQSETLTKLIDAATPKKSS